MARGFVYNNILTCLSALFILLIINVPDVETLASKNLYPYTGSTELETDVNGQSVSAEAVLKTPISFYDKIYNSIFVNANGVLSFARAMQRWFNIAFPLDDPVIAPLYTHVDTRGSGKIYWIETDSEEVLNRAGGFIRSSFKSAQDFTPIHAFIATWVNVGYYNERSDKLNTYQVVISSNGNKSFVEILYQENGIQWIQGESHPSGLPDAKAQAGMMSEGRMYTLKGSGTDQIQNLDKWSNVNRPGQWLFQIGPITDSENVKTPDSVDDNGSSNEIPTCRTGVTTCHSKATCVDYESGFCCSCKEGYFGNGKSCQPNDIPIRVIGRIRGTINGIEFPTRDLQCYVQTRDGRTYTALSRVPEEIGPSFQLLNQLGSIIGWLFARPISDMKNGYQITGGAFNETTELKFTSSGHTITIKSTYLGLDVFGQLKMEAEITGTLPILKRDTKVDYNDHDELYTRSSRGMIRTKSERACKLIEPSGEEQDCRYSKDQIITFQECPYAKMNSNEETTRLKFYRGVTTYESTEGIIRYAVNTKIAPLEEEDPCIRGKSSCGAHSSCVVDGDDFKCVCNPGYQYLYEEDGSAICVDINECTAGNHVCAPDAQCVNQEGSHVCHCRTGFVGNGRVCERLPTCEDTRCDEHEKCVMISENPSCVCDSGYVKTPEGCYPDNRASCDMEDNCSPNGLCSSDGDKKKHVCVCLPGFVGDGYSCYSESNPSTRIDELPEPTCLMGVCWCTSGWEHKNGQCIKQDTGTTESNDNRDLLARPLPECMEATCICPFGYEYKQLEEICHPKPGYKHDTMGPSGSHLSCNVVNRCHPYAQCIYITSTGNYECRCNLGYGGDGMECIRAEVSCMEVDICDPNASCQHDETSMAECVCNPGYGGDGTTCSPIDECNTDTECELNEKCIYNPTNSRYQCTCNQGYSMVDGQCIVADCSTNPAQCHLNAQCVSNREGGFKCACVTGYHGDGVNQCIEDHIGCTNCGKNALCSYNETGGNYACTCQPGYHGDGFTCIPQISCAQDTTLCSRNAACTTTSANHYSCVCNEGYVGDGVDCKPRPKHDSNFLLVNQGMATLRIPYEPSNENRGSPIYIAYTQMAIALEIDCLRGRAYSSDITGNRIVELTYNGSVAETFLINVTSPEGLSIDWISRNIFWTDSGKETLEVANLVTKKRKVLVSEGLVNPRGIAVHPYRGKIFWSDWNRASPKLEWVNEDGTGRAIFLQGDYVKLPNSLAIDWSTDELCWTDAGTMTITCVEIDSKEISVAVNQLSYPFGLAISSNHYYWTDWKTHKIEVAMKTTGERKKSISIPPGGNGKLYGTVVVPDSCPRVSNVCQYENGRCNPNQLCLPDGQGGRACVCADNADGFCQDLRYPS